MKSLGERVFNPDPEHRQARKELEKKHPFSFKEPLLLTMLGVGLIWNIENQVAKKAERDEKEDQENEDREERRRRRREREIRAGTWDPRQDDRGWAGRDRQLGYGDRDSSMASRDTRNASRGHRDDAPRAAHRYYEDRDDDSRRGPRREARRGGGRYDDHDRYEGRYDRRYDDYYDRYDDRRSRGSSHRPRRDSF